MFVRDDETSLKISLYDVSEAVSLRAQARALALASSKVTKTKEALPPGEGERAGTDASCLAPLLPSLVKVTAETSVTVPVSPTQTDWE